MKMKKLFLFSTILSKIKPNNPSIWVSHAKQICYSSAHQLQSSFLIKKFENNNENTSLINTAQQCCFKSLYSNGNTKVLFKKIVSNYLRINKLIVCLYLEEL